MPVLPVPSRTPEIMRQLVTALSAGGYRGPSLANQSLRARACDALGPGPLRWAAEVATATAPLVVARHPDRTVHVEALGAAHEEMLLAILLTLVGRPAPPGSVAVSQPEIIRQVVAEQVPLDRLVAAIRILQKCWIDKLLAHAVDNGARPDVQQSIVLVTTQIMDRYLDTQIKDFVAEQERVRHSSTAQRRRTIEDLVRGHRIDPALATRHLGVDLHDDHIGFVLTTSDHTEQGRHALWASASRLEQVAPVLLRHDAAKEELWLWASGSRGEVGEVLSAVSRVTVHDVAVRIGVGSAHRGAAGFRRSHLEAVDAQSVARNTRRGPVVLHRDVELAVLLSQDPERAHWFVETHLGPLADPATRELRETLQCFYGTGMRLVNAATQLRVHRNTLMHRLRRVESLLGHPVEEDIAEVLCAMIVLELVTERPAAMALA